MNIWVLRSRRGTYMVYSTEPTLTETKREGTDYEGNATTTITKKWTGQKVYGICSDARRLPLFANLPQETPVKFTVERAKERNRR